MVLSNRSPYIILPTGHRYMKLTAHSHLNPTRTGLCHKDQQVDLKEACQCRGFRGKLMQFRIEKTRKSHQSSFSQVKNSKKKCKTTYLTSNPSSDVKSNLIYSRSEELSNHTQSQDTNRSTPLAGLPSTSAPVYSRRRCSKAFRALPTIEEGRILYYTVMKYILFEE